MLTHKPTYRIPRPARLSMRERAILRQAGQHQVLFRLAELMGQGKIAASEAGRVFLAFKQSGVFEEK